MGLLNASGIAAATGNQFQIYIGAKQDGNIATSENVDKNTGTGYSITKTGDVVKLQNTDLSTALPGIQRGDRLTIQRSVTASAVDIGADVLAVTTTTATLVNIVNASTSQAIPDLLPYPNTAGVSWTVGHETFAALGSQTDAGVTSNQQTAELNIKNVGETFGSGQPIAFQSTIIVSESASLTFNTASPQNPIAGSFDEQVFAEAIAQIRRLVSCRFVEYDNFGGRYSTGFLSISGPTSTTPDTFPTRDYTLSLSRPWAYVAPIQ